MIRLRDAPYWVLVALTILMMFFAAMNKAARASADDGARSLPWTCAQVRQFVAVATPDEVAALARRLSREQRRQAKACLMENK